MPLERVEGERVKGCNVTPDEFAIKIFNGEKVPLPSEMGKDMEWAREACEKLGKLMTQRWGPIIGLKAGLTSEESRRKFGGGPIYGPLHKENVLTNISELNITNDFVEPMVEIEIAVVNETKYLAIEVPNNRYGKGWSALKAVDIQADLGGEGVVILVAPFENKAHVSVNGKSIIVEDLAGKGWVYGWLNSINDSLSVYLLGTIVPPIPLKDKIEVRCCGKSITLTYQGT